ncbi:MAG: nucleotidyltransferase substrate binding protein [Chloroflexi bacterium]|nr:nucleotidyltransferase substrate binding protein [Chloroflexota bacterium]
MTSDVDLQTFRDALCRLEEALRDRAAEPGNTYLRDAVILRFTLTFEAAASVLARYLQFVAAVRDPNRMSPRRRLREAADLGLIAECSDWLRHMENRDRVSHAYLESMAIMVAKGAPPFAADARALLSAMERGIADGG